MRLAHTVRGAIGLLALTALGASCGSGGGSSQGSGRTVLLVTVEGLNTAAKLPALEKLGQGGRRFTDVLSASPMARPSAASLLTGLAPDRSGVRDSVHDELPSDVPTLASLLQAAGWSTGAFVGSPSCGPESGLDRGFTLFDGKGQSQVGPGRWVPKARPAAEVAKNAEAWLAALPPKANAFAWVHFADLRSVPYEVDDLKVGAAETYATAVTGLDAPLTQIVEAARKRKSVEIVVVGTHGVYTGEEGRYGDSYWLDGHTLSVPLVWTGGRGGSGPDARPIWLPDVAATLAASTGVTLGSAAEGIDLGGDAPPKDRLRPAWTWAPDDELAWPNLSTSPDRPATPRPRTLSAETRARIEKAGIKLGKEPKVWKEFPQGSEMVALRLGKARYFISIEREGPARVTARQGFADHPDDLGLRVIHMYIAWRGGDKQKVQETADKLLALYPDRQETLHWVGHFEGAQKHPEASEALLQGALEVGPPEPDLLYDLACARSLAGDVPAGLSYLGRAIEAGFHEWEWMDKDSDLAALRADPKYAELRRAAGR